MKYSIVLKYESNKSYSCIINLCKSYDYIKSKGNEYPTLKIPIKNTIYIPYIVITIVTIITTTTIIIIHNKLKGKNLRKKHVQRKKSPSYIFP